MPHLRRDSFTLLRELMRWRVAMVLSVLIFVLMIVLGTINTRLGLADTALLAWITLAVAGGCIAALLALPKHLGGTVFFISIAGLLVGVMVFGLYHDRPMQHWAYIFPPVLVFLVSSRVALAGMGKLGSYELTAGSDIDLILRSGGACGQHGKRTDGTGTRDQNRRSGGDAAAVNAVKGDRCGFDHRGLFVGDAIGDPHAQVLGDAVDLGVVCHARTGGCAPPGSGPGGAPISVADPVAADFPGFLSRLRAASMP